MGVRSACLRTSSLRLARVHGQFSYEVCLLPFDSGRRGWTLTVYFWPKGAKLLWQVPTYSVEKLVFWRRLIGPKSGPRRCGDQFSAQETVKTWT